MKRIGILATLAFLMIGCGSGGSNSSSALPIVDNSKLTLTKNKYGYFGDDVKLGDYKARRTWNLHNKDGSADDILLYIYSDGRLKIQSIKTNKKMTRDAGISKDGLQVRFRDGISANPDSITIVSISHDTQTITQSNGDSEIFKCYNTKLEAFGIDAISYVMCPW